MFSDFNNFSDEKTENTVFQKEKSLWKGIIQRDFSGNELLGNTSYATSTCSGWAMD